MMMTTMPEFLALIGKPRLHTIPLESYFGHTYVCSCGFAHVFDDKTKVLCEGYNRMILVCPKTSLFLTNVRIRTLLIEVYGGLDGAFGTFVETAEDNCLLNDYLAKVWDNPEFHWLLS